MVVNAALEVAPHHPGFQRLIGDSFNPLAHAVCRM
jgi:hypothetical protein